MDLERRDESVGDPEEIFLEWARRVEAGESLSVEDLLARHPRQAEALARLVNEFELSFGADEEASPRTGREIPTLPEMRSPAAGESAIGPYSIETRVARGGGGTLYRARHRQFGHVVALKVIAKREIFDPRDLERFRTEARLLRELALVGVCPVLETGEDDELAWMALKWIEGQNLAAFARSEIPTTPAAIKERLELSARLCRIFQAVHEHGILHRDIKPSNVLIDRTRDPIVIDFGISRQHAAPSLTGPLDAVMGTPRYIAPEVLDGGNAKISERSEVFALGLTAYELLAGSYAYAETETRLLFDAMREGRSIPLGSAQPLASREVIAVISRAMHPDAKLRYPTMAEFAEDLEALVANRPIARETQRLAGFVSRLRTWVYQRRYAAISLCCGLLLGGLVAGEALWSRLKWERHAEVLARYSFIPHDLAPPPDEALAAALAAVAEDPSAAPNAAREDAAWWHFAKGAHAQGLAILGTSLKDEPRSTERLRLWIAMHLEHLHAEERESGVVYSPPEPEGSSPTRRHRVLSPALVGADLAEARLQLSRRSPPLEAVTAHLTKLPTPPKDPRSAMIDFVLFAQSLPTAADRARWQPWIDELRRRVTALQQEDRNQWHAAWQHYCLGVCLLEMGEAQSAAEEIAQCARIAGDLAEVQLAYGQACAARDGEDDLRLALDCLAKAREGFLARIDREAPRRANAFADMPWQHLWMRAIDLELRRGNVLAARAYWAEADRLWHRGPVLDWWPFEALHAVTAARIAMAQREYEAARDALLALAELDSNAALPFLELERIALAEERPLEELKVIREKLASAARKMPDSLDAILRGYFFGLRPYARVDLFQGGISSPR